MKKKRRVCHLVTYSPFILFKICFTSKNSHEVHRLFLSPRHQTKNYLKVPEQDDRIIYFFFILPLLFYYL